MSKKLFSSIVPFVIVIVLALPTFSESLQSEYTRYQATVVRVIDGDTLEVASLPSIAPTERVRLLGIDTPEKNDLYGTEATLYTESLLTVGSTIYIEIDVRARDSFGRYLSYVFLPDGRMVNLMLVEAGLAKLYTEAPNVRYTDEFQDALKTAQQTCRGIWSDLDHCKVGYELTVEVQLESELVIITNVGKHSVNMSGWTIRSVVGDQKDILPAGTVLEPGETLVVVSGGNPCPLNAKCHLWNGTGRSNIWNNSGDTAELWDTQGRLVLSRVGVK
ncbi:MAG: thermonuclease family protein [Limnochordia bacterium]|jgi:micrococcal nuclease|nr:hypothetical protein [Clostridiales bacterium]